MLMCWFCGGHSFSISSFYLFSKGVMLNIDIKMII